MAFFQLFERTDLTLDCKVDVTVVVCYTTVARSDINIFLFIARFDPTTPLFSDRDHSV